ncbi:uncharacterized protein TNCV_1179651 [Trichonephila clavipes]|nr:uncharacterized protein TNCV_1179651 [Trichonephila clavipes]
MGHEDELTIEELQEILYEEHQETQRNVSPSDQEEDERGPMPTSAIKDILKKWEAVRAMVLEWHPNQADVSRSSYMCLNNTGVCHCLSSRFFEVCCSMSCVQPPKHPGLVSSPTQTIVVGLLEKDGLLRTN